MAKKDDLTVEQLLMKKLESLEKDIKKLQKKQSEMEKELSRKANKQTVFRGTFG